VLYVTTGTTTAAMQVLRVRDKTVFAALDADSRKGVFKEIAQELAMMVSSYCM
jgi:hypothetical protein